MRYWISQYERRAMENMHEKKIEISKEIQSLIKKWSKSRNKVDIRELKKVMTQAKTNSGSFSQAIISMGKTGDKLIDMYLKSWMILGPKPRKAKSVFVNLMRNSLKC